MKKIQSSLIGMILISSSAANASFFCGYKDYFRIESQGSSSVFIVRASNDPDLNLEILSPTSFEIKDTVSCNSGFAHVVVANKDFGWCLLDIKDGPFMMHPTVNASCTDLQYKGRNYSGFNSYTYTLNFE